VANELERYVVAGWDYLYQRPMPEPDRFISAKVCRKLGRNPRLQEAMAAELSDLCK
jgi:hypothetical protein